jgi:hypothetical protein
MEFFVYICDTIDQPILCTDIESVANPVYTVIQITEIAAQEITQGRFNIQVILVDLGSGVHV